MKQAGLSFDDAYVTNTFNLRPHPKNDIKNLCGPRTAGIPGIPALSSGKYVRAEYAKELERLDREVKEAEPNLVIALGNTPLWALLHKTPSIRAMRGAPIWCDRLDVKVLPTYHPAAVLREYKLKPVLLADLIKAQREQEYPEVRAPQREIWTKPTVEDIKHFAETYLLEAREIAADIETKNGQITMIGFAPSNDVALVIPFYDMEKDGGNYWDNPEDEYAAMRWVRWILSLPARFIFQNGMYDMQWLWRVFGMPVPNAADDSMLAHHALQPEMEKSLGFLGSIYTDEPAWKFMGKSKKREDT